MNGLDSYQQEATINAWLAGLVGIWHLACIALPAACGWVLLK
jgi:hypothetical protein